MERRGDDSCLLRLAALVGFRAEKAEALLEFGFGSSVLRVMCEALGLYQVGL